MTKGFSRTIWIVLFVAYVLGVAWLCFTDSQSEMEFPDSLWDIPIDKCVHFLMFLPFPVLGTLAFDFRSWWRCLCIMTFVALVIAFVFEHLQSIITTTRVTDPADLNANVLGISTGLFVMMVWGLIRKRN